MVDLRKEARNRPCMVRIPGVCNGDRSTTVLAHYNGAGLGGMGTKSPDVCGAWCCSSCHSTIDGARPRPEGFSRQDAELAHLQGCMRTLAMLAREGKVLGRS